MVSVVPHVLCSAMSDSVAPALGPARHLCPWVFPGKNAGVSYRFLVGLPYPGVAPGSPALQEDTLPLVTWAVHLALMNCLKRNDSKKLHSLPAMGSCPSHRSLYHHKSE